MYNNPFGFLRINREKIPVSAAMRRIMLEAKERYEELEHDINFNKISFWYNVANTMIRSSDGKSIIKPSILGLKIKRYTEEERKNGRNPTKDELERKKLEFKAKITKEEIENKMENVYFINQLMRQIRIYCTSHLPSDYSYTETELDKNDIKMLEHYYYDLGICDPKIVQKAFLNKKPSLIRAAVRKLKNGKILEPNEIRKYEIKIDKQLPTAEELELTNKEIDKIFKDNGISYIFTPPSHSPFDTVESFNFKTGEHKSSRLFELNEIGGELNSSFNTESNSDKGKTVKFGYNYHNL